jgi:hypothetical protein
MSRKEFVEFVKEHKVEIAIGVGSIALATVLGVKTLKMLKSPKCIEALADKDPGVQALFDFYGLMDKCAEGNSCYLFGEVENVAGLDLAVDTVKTLAGEEMKVKNIIMFGDVVNN